MAERKPTKTEGGVAFPAEAYAYVPDPERPSTWKLRLWEDPEKRETARQVGMAVAALGKGFRGNRVDIPPEDLPAVKRRVRQAWLKTHPDATEDDLPPVLREAGPPDGATDGTRLVEYTSSARLRLNVDRERGLISGVKVLGLVSANGRRYSVEALRRAVSLYEGRPVNIDHVNGSERRSYRDRIGKLVNVRLAEDGIYADLVVNPKHPLAEQLFWDAEHAPENVGLSHDARGKTVVRDGQVVVESIESVRSVDLVAEPATTRSLYESKDDEDGETEEPAPPSQEPQPVAVATVEPPPDVDEIDDPDTLPDDAFALVLPGGVRIRDKTYPLSKRWFPINSPAAVRRSLVAIVNNKRLSAYHKQQALERAKQAALRFGINYHTILSGVSQEAQQMDLSQLTLAELKEARPDLIEAIRAQNELEAELVQLKQENARLAEELSRLKRREAISQELREASLPVDAVPASLMQILEETDDQGRRRAIINDLARTLRQARPVSSGPRYGTEDITQLVNRWRV